MKSTPIKRLKGETLAALLLYWGMALDHLGTASFWYDELFNIDLTLAHRWNETLRILLTEQPYPPLYALWLKFWERLTSAQPYAPGLEPGGGLEFMLRLSSVVAGMAALATLVPLGRRIGLRRANWLPWLLAVHPTLLWYARDLRLYPLWLFLVAASLWAVSAGRMGRYLLFGTAAMLTHYFSLFPLGGAAMAALVHERRRRRWFLYLAPFFVAALWMGAARQVTFGFQSFATASPPSASTFFLEAGPQLLTASAFLAPLSIAFSDRAGFALLIVAVVGLGWASFRRREGRIITAALVVGEAATFVAWQVRPVHHVRYLVWSLVPAALGVAAALEWAMALLSGAFSKKPGSRFALWLGLLFLGGAVRQEALWSHAMLRADPTLWHPDFRAAVALLNRESGRDDRVIAEAAHGVQLFSAYRTTLPVVEGPRIGERLRRDEACRLFTGTEGRIWTLLYQDEAVDPGGTLLGTLEANGGYRTTMLYSGELRLFAYTLPDKGTCHPLTPTLPVEATFGPLRLEGATLHREGRLLAVYLFWRLTAPPSTKLFGAVHLTEQIGVPPLAQRDKPILNDYWPLPSLPIGELLSDRYEVIIPPDLPPGRYPLYALVYDPQTGKREPSETGEELVSLGELDWRGE